MTTPSPDREEEGMNEEATTEVVEAAPRRVLKFVLRPETTIIETADEPRFLSVDWQGRDLCVWAEAAVGTGVTSWLGAIPTGGYPPDDGEYVGSAQTEAYGDPLVFHVYRQALS